MNGLLTALVSFSGANGTSPNELVMGNDGYFYGTTSSGGQPMEVIVFGPAQICRCHSHPGYS
jgi:sugar lactone lactonase YvrE